MSLVGGPRTGCILGEYDVEHVADLAPVALGALAGKEPTAQRRIGRRAFLRAPDESIVTKGDAARAQANARARWATCRERIGPGKQARRLVVPQRCLTRSIRATSRAPWTTRTNSTGRVSRSTTR